MKKGYLILIFALVIYQLRAQDTIPEKRKDVHRNFIINVVPDGYNKPLIGILNFAKGSQEALHFSSFNWNQDNLKGVQIGFFNIVGGSVGGSQISITNFCADSTNGMQLGIVNCTKKRNGIQVGFINYSDTVLNGSAIAVLSIVRKGYQGFEIGITEMYPYNISYKIGLKKQYSSANFSFNDTIQKPVFGFGFGFIRSTKRKRIFINPDFSIQNGIFKSKQGLISVSVKLSYALLKKLHISVGPSVIWTYARSSTVNKPIYSIYEYSINPKNNIIVGFRCSLRYNIKGI